MKPAAVGMNITSGLRGAAPIGFTRECKRTQVGFGKSSGHGVLSGEEEPMSEGQKHQVKGCAFPHSGLDGLGLGPESSDGEGRMTLLSTRTTRWALQL